MNTNESGTQSPHSHLRRGEERRGEKRRRGGEERRGEEADDRK